LAASKRKKNRAKGKKSTLEYRKRRQETRLQKVSRASNGSQNGSSYACTGTILGQNACDDINAPVEATAEEHTHVSFPSTSGLSVCILYVYLRFSTKLAFQGAVSTGNSNGPLIAQTGTTETDSEFNAEIFGKPSGITPEFAQRDVTVTSKGTSDVLFGETSEIKMKIAQAGASAVEPENSNKVICDTEVLLPIPDLQSDTPKTSTTRASSPIFPVLEKPAILQEQEFEIINEEYIRPEVEKEFAVEEQDKIIYQELDEHNTARRKRVYVAIPNMDFSKATRSNSPALSIKSHRGGKTVDHSPKEFVCDSTLKVHDGHFMGHLNFLLSTNICLAKTTEVHCGDDHDMLKEDVPVCGSKSLSKMINEGEHTKNEGLTAGIDFEDQIRRMISRNCSEDESDGIFLAGENFEEQVRNILVASSRSNTEGSSRRSSRQSSPSDVDSEGFETQEVVAEHISCDQSEPNYGYFGQNSVPSELRDEMQNAFLRESLSLNCHNCSKPLKHANSVACQLCGINSIAHFCSHDCRLSCGKHWEWCGLMSLSFSANAKARSYTGPFRTNLHLNPYRFWNATVLSEYPRFDFCLFKWGLVHNESPYITYAIVFDNQPLRDRFYAVYKRAFKDSNVWCVRVLWQVVREWVRILNWGISDEELGWQFAYEFPEAWPSVKFANVSQSFPTEEEWRGVEEHLSQLLHHDGMHGRVIHRHHPLVWARPPLPPHIRSRMATGSCAAMGV
jgi:hypothetical protein